MKRARKRSSKSSAKSFARGAKRASQHERKVQRRIDAKEKNKPKPKDSAMQAGARKYPELPLPAQHLKKPGQEADLRLAPMYDAPHYKGSEKLAR